MTLYSAQVAQKSGGFSTLARGWGQSGYGSTQNLILRRGRVARGRRGLLLAPRPTGASLASGVRRGEGGAGRGARGAGRGARVTARCPPDDRQMAPRCPRDDPQMTLDGVDFPKKNDLQGCVFYLSHESATETTPGDRSRPGTTDLARTGTPSDPLPPYNGRGKGWGMGDPPTLLLL